MEESLYGLFSFPSLEVVEHSQPQHSHGANPSTIEWTFEENKLFEDALADFNISSPDFFENLASRVPFKSVEDIKKHYKALVNDLQMIESGQFIMLDYEDDLDNDDHVEQEETKMKGGYWDGHPIGRSPSWPHNEVKVKPRNNGPPRRRGVPWTENEHQLFLMGLNKYGKGDWVSISKHYVTTKNPMQIASHAQKYFRRQNSSTPPNRRRYSINDIHTINPIPISTAAADNNTTGSKAANPALGPSANPNFSASNDQIPGLYTGFHGGASVDQNPLFLPMPSSSTSPFASTAAIMNPKPVAANNPVVSYMFPSLENNQPWN